MIKFRSLAQNNMAAEQVLSYSSQASAIEIKNANVYLSPSSIDPLGIKHKHSEIIWWKY